MFVPRFDTDIFPSFATNIARMVPRASATAPLVLS
jgi:hypothetical protein